MTTHIITCPRRGKAIVEVAEGHSPPARFNVEFTNGDLMVWKRWEWREMADFYVDEGCKVVYRGFVSDCIRVTHEVDGTHTVWVKAHSGPTELTCSANGNLIAEAISNFWYNWNDMTDKLHRHPHLSIAFHRKRYKRLLASS